MGAKQSKRSVDISGKEAESAGEVAAAGAGGEGRVEQLADADALKPQLNGDAHINEAMDKEKQIDSGTPEIEKDVTTEKEGKEEEEGKEKDASAVTNGDSEPKEENGEAVTTSEDPKKPKKEKVKKKWSLRSISFSRKDKPKQEKKAKEDDLKTPNGDSEKLPEEVAESTPKNAVNEVAEEIKSNVEAKDEKTPETPVTEPITNGSSTPESPKTEPSPIDEPIPETPEDTIRPEPKVILAEPEQLPVNGLSLEESKVEAPEVTKNEESNIEKPTSETSESVAAPEIPVKNEVCVEQMSMIEPSPPPLPANPPPSSVASFAATTMAPELTDASLANDITTTTTPIAITDTNKEVIDKDSAESNLNELDDENVVTNIPTSINEILEGNIAQDVLDEVKPESENIIMTTINEDSEQKTYINSDETNAKNNSNVTPVVKIVPDNMEIPEIVQTESPQPTMNLPSTFKLTDSNGSQDDAYAAGDKEPSSDNKETTVDNKNVTVAEMNDKNSANVEYLKNTAKECQEAVKEVVCNAIVEDESNEIDEIPPKNAMEEIENKMTTPEDSLPPSLSEAVESNGGDVTNDGSESFPQPPSELCRYDEVPPMNSPQPAASQEIITVADKMVDLIPEVPVVPELKTDMETSDVAVAN